MMHIKNSTAAGLQLMTACSGSIKYLISLCVRVRSYLLYVIIKTNGRPTTIFR